MSPRKASTRFVLPFLILICAPRPNGVEKNGENPKKLWMSDRSQAHPRPAANTQPSRPQNANLVGGADGCQPSQIPPPVTAVKFAVGREQPFRPQGLIKQVGRVASVPEQQH